MNLSHYQIYHVFTLLFPCLLETAPKIKKFSNADDDSIYTVSELRSKTAPLLEDIDPTYAGRKVSRKSLDLFNDGMH